MKLLIAFSACMLSFGAAYAQKQPLPPIHALPQQAKGFHKSAIGGYFTDMRRQPVKGIKAFIYMPDSSIAASGYTDAMGYYETNSVLPGLYMLKIVYPTSKASIMITGVPVKASTITDVSFLKSDAPAADTTIAYTEIAPKPVEKKKK